MGKLNQKWSFVTGKSIKLNGGSQHGWPCWLLGTEKKSNTNPPTAFLCETRLPVNLRVDRSWPPEMFDGRKLVFMHFPAWCWWISHFGWMPIVCSRLNPPRISHIYFPVVWTINHYQPLLTIIFCSGIQNPNSGGQIFYRTRYLRLQFQFWVDNRITIVNRAPYIPSYGDDHHIFPLRTIHI